MVTNNTVVRIGTRRVRLTLEAPVEAPDALGGAAIAYQPIVTLWARIEVRGGRERLAGERPEGTADTRITIRWRGGVDARMRFSLGARVFAVQAAFDPDGRRRELVCLCEEISS